MSAATLDALEEIVRDAVGLDHTRTLDPAQPLCEAGLDSLALVNAVAAIEGAFDLELPDSVWDDRRGITLEVLAEAVGPADPSGAAPAFELSDPIEQPGVSRLERLFAQLAGRGAKGRLLAAGLRCALGLQRWAASRHELTVLVCDLERPLAASAPPTGIAIAVLPPDDAGEALAEVWPAGLAPLERRRLRRHLRHGVTCLVATENGRALAYDLLAATGDGEVQTAPGTCLGFDLYERREARGRGIGPSLLAASLETARVLGFRYQATIVLTRNRPMIAAATQLHGFAVAGRARRVRLLGLTRWRWQLRGKAGSGWRLPIDGDAVLRAACSD